MGGSRTHQMNMTLCRPELIPLEGFKLMSSVLLPNMGKNHAWPRGPGVLNSVARDTRCALFMASLRDCTCHQTTLGRGSEKVTGLAFSFHSLSCFSSTRRQTPLRNSMGTKIIRAQIAPSGSLESCASWLWTGCQSEHPEALK